MGPKTLQTPLPTPIASSRPRPSMLSVRKLAIPAVAVPLRNQCPARSAKISAKNAKTSRKPPSRH
ncbi:hypothetical protein I7I53_08591 [Histoplasma capsulatum var. duboisii H88]|uniref:Uncharacterized protein n=2 Tax=Ajellomyces capsulatus TaxID=5037 RepID=A0A8H7YD07_AJECA|nr:hypothetical protein I7I52_11099 [Histoplasma capsulatum]QSS52839.1 hypothetical protein I7I53_08591 [Histoplasma capsulatum var. duboisii H88]QSS70835.1 hypothetical protein I7I50_12596 [Histoplasma capsulatum G186AR]